MRPVDGITVAMAAIRANKLRSLLTVLGIVIGIAAVITMVAIGSGAREQVQTQVASMGANLLMLTPGNRRVGGVMSQSNQTLSEDDAIAIRREVAGVQVVAPARSGNGQLVFGRSNAPSRVEGITPDYMEAREWTVEAGRGFSPSEARSGGLVALVGATIVRELFGDADPLGETIRINQVPVTIVGTLKAKGQTTFGMDQDRIVMVPLQASRRILGNSRNQPNRVDLIVVKTASAAVLEPVSEEIRALLRQRMRIQPGQPETFEVRNLTEFMSTFAETTRTMSLLVAAIASISLLVGGIGIMNTMLVSVTERTREIGLRLAVGARPRDIMVQFLIEAVTLCLIGGAIGITLGVGLAAGAASLVGVPVLIQPGVIVMSFAISAGIGIFFGFWPARRAARLDPIEALRFE